MCMKLDVIFTVTVHVTGCVNKIPQDGIININPLI